MYLKSEDKTMVAVVTGGSRGIGKSIAEELLKKDVAVQLAVKKIKENLRC